MHSITTALENLTRQLSQEIPATPGLCVFDAPFPLNDAFDALSWLASQSSFPQFYWQQRNGDEEAAVLGAITVFSSLDLAQRFYVSTRSLTYVFGAECVRAERGLLIAAAAGVAT